MPNQTLIPQWPWLPEASLRARQARQLRRWLEQTVLPASPHFREVFRKAGVAPADLQTLEDLRRLPFMSKADLTSGPEAVRKFVLVPDREALARRPSTIVRALLRGRRAVQAGFEHEYRPLLLTSTTGRSAEPVPFVYTGHDLAVLRSAGVHVMQTCGANKEHRMLNLFPFAPHLAFWITHYAGEAFGVFMVGSGGGKTMGTDGNLRLIRKLKPDVLIGMPTFLYHVLTQAVEEGVALPNLAKLVLGGEKVPTGMRRRLRKLAAALGAEEIDVLCTYGFTEAKMAWAECPYPAGATSGGYHLAPELGIVEIVDPESGEPRGLNQPGEIVFTPLQARGSVVLRYRTGDCIDGGLTYASCPHCGRTVPRLVGNISRRSEVREMQFGKLKGTIVDFNRLEHVLDDCDDLVSTFQIELRKRNDDPLEVDELLLHVVPAPGAARDRVRHELENRFAERLELRPNEIRLYDDEAMRQLQGVGTELKEVRLVDRRPEATLETEVAR